MAESRIKIRATLTEMRNEFNNPKSNYYDIRHYNGIKDYIDEDNIIFDVLVRHVELGNKKLERKKPYTFTTLKETIENIINDNQKEEEKAL